MVRMFDNSHIRRLLLLIVTALIAAVLSGCQAWNAWLDLWRWKDPPPKAPAGTAAGAATMTLPSPAAGGSAANALLPRVTVYMITLPLGTFSGNDQIWSQLNEDAIDSKTAVLMAQNGLRAATGSAARWPAISRLLLDTPGAMYYPSVLQTDGRTSIPVITRQNALEQTVVSVDRDHQIQGRTYEKCDNGFRLAMRASRPRPGSPAELQLQLEPIVSLGNVQVFRPGLGVTSSTIATEESFVDLRMTATLNAEQFLVISPLDPKANNFSIGTLWLTDRDKVPATETVLVFVPATAPADK